MDPLNPTVLLVVGLLAGPVALGALIYALRDIRADEPRRVLTATVPKPEVVDTIFVGPLNFRLDERPTMREARQARHG